MCIDIHVKYPLFVLDFIKTWICSKDFAKPTGTSNFVKNPSVGNRVVPGGRQDGQINMTKLTVAFCKSSNAPKEKGRPGNVVGIATSYGLDGPGIESRLGARFSAPVQTGLGNHPASCTMGTGSFPGVKNGRGMTPTPHSLLVPWWRKSRAIPLPVEGCTLLFTWKK